MKKITLTISALREEQQKLSARTSLQMEVLKASNGQYQERTLQPLL